jgi:hypothetical protein
VPWTLIDHLGGIVRNSCKRRGAADNAPADVVIETTPDPISGYLPSINEQARLEAGGTSG